jgi:methionyl-tRNA synthetase
LSALQDKVRAYVDSNKENWRPTTINESNKYLDQGLKDRAITRDLNWGIPVPFPGYENKRLYVWVEAVMGYLTAGEQACDSLGLDFEKFITNPDMTSYYSHGKDNIVFHTIILPALIMAIDDNMNKPNMIIACEYINVNNEKMSKSKGNLTSVNTLLANFDSDSIRYYFTFNNPERKDASFSLDDFISTHNKMIVGGYGNFVNRNLAFLAKKFDGVLPKLSLDKEVEEETKNAYKKIGELIEKGELKTAALEAYYFVQFANKYYDKNTPWVLANTDKDALIK